MWSNDLNQPNGPMRALIAVCFLASVLHSENDACLSRNALIGVSGANALTAADLKVTVGGKAASLQSVTPADRSPRVVILLDVSGNHDQSTWTATQGLVDEFLAGFPEVGDFTLVTFDDGVRREIHETDRASLQGTLGELFPSGKPESEAGLAAALKEASVSFGTYRQGDAEFLVTTADQIHKETVQTLNQQRTDGIRILGASFDQSRRRGPAAFGVASVADYSPIEAATKASGGWWIRFDMSSQDPPGILRSVRAAGKEAAALVRNYFVLELRLAKVLTKPEKLKVEIIKSPKIGAKDISIAYPLEMVPCP
jgi:hypothetical protein